MTKTEQYRKRVKTILNSLGELRYSKVRRVDRLRMIPGDYKLEQIFQKDVRDWPEFSDGDTWGGRDSHYWFYAPVTIPEEYARQTVVLSLHTGASDIWNTDNPQVIVYVDGEMKATMDMNHNRMILTEQAEAGKAYETAFYAYSNSERRTNFFSITTAVLHPQVEALYYDIKVLWEAADLCREDDLERIHLFELLNSCVSHLDLRNTAGAEFFRSVETAAKWLRENYYEAEHPVSPVTVHGVGHTHIDVAWKWPLRQTRQKAVRSFLTVLNLMDRYPEYRFMSSQPQLYEFVKEEAPDVYERIRERVREGRWETEGAMWLEPDCNLISGESMIRQILYGKEFFAEEFGKGDNEVLWLPDVFGYSVAMPQILKQSGIRYFMTTKIGWNEYNQIPNDTMLWRGLDGSEVLAYFITTSDYCTYPELAKKRSFETTYNGRFNANQVMGTWQRYQNKKINEDVLTCYGYGDGGGGPTEQMLEEGRRLAVGVGQCPKVRQTSVKEFFHLLEKNLEGKKVPKWDGELYLEFHRGTYTSMARNKKHNRQCEFLMSDAEFFQVLAMELDGRRDYPGKELEQAWKLFLLNQFHDILPGSSCKDVYEDSDIQYEEIRRIGGKLVSEACGSILKCEGFKGDTDGLALAVFNQLGFERTGIVTISGETDGGCFQKAWDGSNLYLVKNAVSKGVQIVNITDEPAKGLPVIEHSEMNEGQLSAIHTGFYDIVFNEAGELKVLFDKEENREVLKAGEAGNRLIAFEDRPAEYDAWNIDAYFEEKQWNVSELSEFRILENGPLRACVYSRRRFLNSEIEQYMYLYRHTKRIDFKTRVDWREHQILLKTVFPIDVLASRATYEVQFGNVERPTHRNTSWDEARFEVCAHKWADISECGYGAALLNDCKYGIDIHESVMRLTLIKSGIFPNPDADNEVHEFTYSLYPHKGDFREGRVIQEAYDLNCPLYGTVTKGLRETSCSYMAVDARNVFADTVKRAEDGDGVILRFYEAYGKRTQAGVRLPFGTGMTAEECDCMEQPIRKLCVSECGKEMENAAGITLQFRPYEIKTIRLRKE